MTLSEFSVKKPITVLMLILSIVVLGVIALDRLPLAYLPEISGSRLTVLVPYNSSSPQEIDQLITKPLEDILSTVSHLKKITSQSTAVISRITLEFKPGIEMNLAAMEVRERIERVRNQLPDDIGRISVRRWQTTDFPVIRFGMAWKDGARSFSDLMTVAERVIDRRLQRIDGVANVDIRGMQQKVVTINLNHDLLRAHEIDLFNVRRLIQRENISLPGGSLVDGGKKYSIRSLGELKTLEEIGDLPLKGSTITLKDIAEITYDFPEKKSFQRLNHDDAVSVLVYKESTANLIDVAERVKKEIDSIKAEPGLEQLSTFIFHDQSKDIIERIDSLKQSGLLGAILAVGILFLFLRSVRSVLVIAASIPISIICAFLIMYLMRMTLKSNITINMVSLMGLMMGVGMLVDNSIVVLENIFRHRHEKGLGPVEAAIMGSREVGIAILASTLTTVIVFLPVIFLKGVQFSFIMNEFGMVVTISMIASFVVAVTLIPLLSSKVLIEGETGRVKLINLLTSAYLWMMRGTLRFRWTTLLVISLILGGSFYLLTKIDREFLPQSPRRMLNFRVDLPRSFDTEAWKNAFDEIEAALLSKKESLEIKTLSTFFWKNEKRVDIFFLDLTESRTPVGELREKVRKELPKIPGVTYRFGRQRDVSDSEMGISIELKGEDEEVLALLGEEMKSRLTNIWGVRDVDTELEATEDEISVSVDRELTARRGLTPRRVAGTITGALTSRPVSRFKTEEKEVDMTLQLREEDRQTLDQLKNMTFENERIEMISLDTVANFRVKRGVKEIKRDDKRKVVTVSANTDGTGRGFIQGEIKRRLQDFQMPPGYSWNFGEEFRSANESESNYQFAVVMAVVLIYMVMAALFESFVHPFTILFSIPFAMIGVAGAFYYTKTTFNAISYLGLLILAGTVVNNGIILIDYINRLRKEGMEKTEAIMMGGKDRLRPILMTAVTTILGLLPMILPFIFPKLYGPVEGTARFYSPVGIAIVGGLTTSTFLTLIILPTTYSLVDDLERWIRKVLVALQPAKRR